MKKYDLIEFIDELLMPDLSKMIDHGLHYYAFAVICQGIEVLGSIYDQKGIDESGASESRFDNAITNLFKDRRYREKQDLFYSFLRGPLIHQLRPGAGLFISSSKQDNIKIENHLERHEDSGHIILVIEQFFQDFQEAFDTFKRQLKERSDLDNKKAEQNFISVSTISPPYPTNWWDKESNSLITVTPSITGRAY